MKSEELIAVNEFRGRVFGTDAARLIGFVCECGDPDCRRTIAMTLEEYSHSRPGLLIHESHGAYHGKQLPQAG